MKLLITSSILAMFAATVAQAAAVPVPPIRRGIDKRKIMEKAVRVNRQGQRILEQNEFEISSIYSLQFNTCVSLPTQPYDEDLMFDEGLFQYTENGYIIAQKSYILFNVCETKYCDYYASDDNLYMIDIDSYMNAVIEFYQERRENYCEPCQESQGYCKWVKYMKQHSTQHGGYNQYVQEYNNHYGGNNQQGGYYQNANQQQNQYQDANEYENANEYQNANGYQNANQDQNGGRRLQDYQDYQNYELIDCEACEVMNCFQDYGNGENGNNYNNGQSYKYYDEDAGQYVYGYIYMEDIVQWVEGMAQCQATEALFLDMYPLYSGFMCNEDGSGIDIALFLDEECSIYNAKTSFKKVASSFDQAVMYEAYDMVTYAFLNKIDCNGEKQYISHETYTDMVSNYNWNAYQNNNQQEAGDASEFCEKVFEGEEAGEAMSLKTCNWDGNEEEQEEEEQNQDGENNNNYNYNNYVNQYQQDYYPYTYVLTYENSQDNQAVCKVIQTLNGEYEPIYKWSSSGQIYDYGTHGKTTSSENIRDWFSQYDALDATLILAVILGIVVAILSGVCIVWSCCSGTPESPKRIAHRQELDYKREQLVDHSTGQLM